MAGKSDPLLEELLGWLFSTQQFGIKLGLENTRRLVEALGVPGMPCFHVAGTNGKGSVCAMLDACLRASGLRIGLYTSPHLVEFSERIRIDGTPISDEGLVCGLGLLRKVSKDWPHCPTFFELSTVLALWWFHQQNCQVLVLETGMGGRLDATNVVDPLVSIITPVAMDHAGHLGDTIEKIAGEKAGIIKPGRPVVSAPQRPEVAEVLRDTAGRTGSPLTFVTGGWDGPCGLEGVHQRENAAVCVAALEASPLEIASGAITAGLAQVQWPGRFTRIGSEWVLDGAHNPHAAEALARTWQGCYGDRKTQVIFGCLADKDASALLRCLEPIAVHFHFVPVPNERTLAPGALVEFVRVPYSIHADLSSALSAAKHGRTAVPVLITGSLFLVGEAVAQIQPGATDAKWALPG